ncbi:MAG: DUF1540 domain-containing protein [Clostridiales bacterium 43-6]|nr:MAG: DUF1540 domain-containing protein [Clostridiales bacterium 43-6]
MNTQKMQQPNEAIKCYVNHCHYYMNGDHCSATQIEVQNKHAKSSQETDCATFTPTQQA